MVKNILLIILGITITFNLKSQEDWLCVYPNKKVYFEDANKMVYCIRIDSTHNDGSVLYPFSDLHSVDFDCFSITSGSWISKYIILNEDGRWKHNFCER